MSATPAIIFAAFSSSVLLNDAQPGHDRLELSPGAPGGRGTTELVAQPDARYVEARMGILKEVLEWQRKAVGTEIVIEIFEPPDPIAGERIFPPAANGPAGMSRRRE